MKYLIRKKKKKEVFINKVALTNHFMIRLQGPTFFFPNADLDWWKTTALIEEVVFKEINILFVYYQALYSNFKLHLCPLFEQLN